MNEKIGIVNPGEMGISVACSVKNSGFDVLWASEGRSWSTRQRAESQDLIEVPSVQQLCNECSVIISVCPPHAAEDVARDVITNGFQGLFLDANAISPRRARRIDTLMRSHEVIFVDGGIIGGPAWKPGTTVLYLSGGEAEEAARFFPEGPLETKIISDEVGNASALKMCFAAFTKGSTALLCAILAAAEDLGVREDLENQWSRGGSDFAEKTSYRVQQATLKAWRFEAEMLEIVDTFKGVGLPGGFHEAAAEIYKRLAFFKSNEVIPKLEDVINALIDSSS